MQSLFVRTKFKSPLCSLLVTVNTAIMWVHISKIFSLLSIGWVRQCMYLYMFTIQASRQYDTIPRPDGNSVIGYFYCLSGEHDIATFVYCLSVEHGIDTFVYCLSGEHGIDTFVYSHICVPVVSSYQANFSRCVFLSTKVSVTFLWKNAVGISILVNADMPLRFRVAILSSHQ